MRTLLLNGRTGNRFLRTMHLVTTFFARTTEGVRQAAHPFFTQTISRASRNILKLLFFRQVNGELARIRAGQIPHGIQKRQLAEKAGLGYEHSTLYSILWDIAHVSAMGLAHYAEQHAKSGKVTFKSDGSLLGPVYLMALAAATQLNILDLVASLLKHALPSGVDDVRRQNGAILHNVKAKGL